MSNTIIQYQSSFFLFDCLFLWFSLSYIAMSAMSLMGKIGTQGGKQANICPAPAAWSSSANTYT